MSSPAIEELADALRESDAAIDEKVRKGCVVATLAEECADSEALERAIAILRRRAASQAD